MAKTGAKADLDKLAYAVSIAETSGCQDGTAQRRNNCVGIIYNGSAAYFPSKQASLEAFKKLWAKPTSYYQGRIPDLRLATTWVCGPHTPTGHTCHNGVDDPKSWLGIVLAHYDDI